MQHLPAAYPRAFHCEHTPSKTRIHALVRHTGGPATLTAILTINDPELAEQAARVLNRALDASPGTVLRGEIDQVVQRLPAAPRASLAQALAHLESGDWPVPSAPPWPALDEKDEQREVPHRLEDEFARTPHMARLEQHPGPVMRIGRLLELHVHDPARTLRAATASGWAPDEDEDLDDEDRLLDAVMWLADGDSSIPGADTVNDASNGQCLAPGGDEVADWSEQPVTFDFGRGWLLDRDERNPSDQVQVLREPQEPRPDYAALFPIPRCAHATGADDEESQDEPGICEECEDFTVTPRTAAVLSCALTTLADECRMDIDEHGDEAVEPRETWWVFDELPRITWRQDAVWRARFAQAAHDLATDLDNGRPPLPRCTAEEVALHLAFDQVEVVLDLADADEQYARSVIGDLLEHPRDYDWDLCQDTLLQDSDVAFLFDHAADGIEDPETDINKHLGIGDLRPTCWFDTFLNMDPRDQGTAPRAGGS